jgi:D-alanyl-D-alanine carboxypeptidase (penicillin-binding protein 5/6)
MTPTRHARWRWLGFLPVLLAFSLFSAPAASAAGAPTTQVPASYVLVDADTGVVLLAHNEHDPHLTASTIKVLTALVTVEHRLLSSNLTISKLTAAQPASRIDMKEGSTWPLDQALHALMIISANDAAYAMAENVGGDLPGFAVMANATAKRLGLKNTDFHDPAGLDGAEGFQDGTTSSAYDLAIVARNALTVPAIADPASKVTYEFTDPTGAGRRLVNHNRGFLTSYPGAIGLKTGFTDQAGRTLITAARRDGRTLIAVVMGTWDDTGWAGYLLDQGFAGTATGGATPVKLPPIRVVPLEKRVNAFTALPHVLGSGAVATEGPAATKPRVTPAAAKPTATPTVLPTAKATAKTAATQAATPAGSAGPATTDGGTTLGSVLTTLAWILFGLLVVAFVLRRRAVKRQRARRLERMRAHREARRRGMIDIIDGDEAEADVRVVPVRTSHHVAAAGKRHPADRRVVRPARPRTQTGISRDRNQPG